MHSRYDAAALPVQTRSRQLAAGWFSGLLLALALRAALRLVAVLG